MRAIWRNPSGMIGFGLLFLILAISLVGPYFIPLDTTTKVTQIYQPPTWAHPLGTDHQGRDVWSQIVHGGRDLLYVAFVAGLLSTAIAVVLGSLAALRGGWFDAWLMALTDVVLTIPQLPLLFVLAGFIRLDSPTLLATLLALLGWPTLLRAIRSQVLSLKEREYIEAARALDLGTFHILFKEILPNMMSYVAIHFTLSMTAAVYGQVGLVILGLVPFSSHNWGVMIQLAWVRGAIFYKDSLLYILSPVLAIALFQFALVSISRSLEEVFNPRLRAEG